MRFIVYFEANIHQSLHFKLEDNCLTAEISGDYYFEIFESLAPN